ncbi:hypothetical protein [Vibrio diabolicus]|uniref:pPIWI-associating nuclease domain-containing protein n=1 Tax=Vibrio diabolicus TaxID=50719 RepID=UPI002285E897|nr:hypothetical protein [Vibrio diabolicus]MCZ0761685.1 hypothetical protein [Vibrio diabolicus]
MKLKRLKTIPEVVMLNSRLEAGFEREVLITALRNYCIMGNPIRFNNFAFVIRELFTRVTNRLAPVEDVKLACWYERLPGIYEVNRKQQVKYCIQGYFADETLPDWIKEDAKEVRKEYLSLYQKLNKYTHINEQAMGKDPREAFVFLKDLLSSFTSILDTIHEIKTHVLEAVEEEVHDIVFNTLMFESHEALIELSSQTVVDVVSVESYSIDRIEPSLVIFKGYGDVECTLNYGSKRDPFSTGHSVPFTFKLCSPVNDVTKIEFYEQGMDLDNSAFYE